jgi:ABC-type nitrate/sulfonate/bicarbonate transport system substrate-binding protein
MKSGRSKRLKCTPDADHRSRSGKQGKFSVAICVGLFLLLSLSVSAAGSGVNGGVTTSAVQVSDVNAIAAKFGVAPPKVTVRFAMMPFGDHMILSAAFANGWFKDVGISVPGTFPTVAFDQAFPRLINNNYDVTTQWAPTMVQNMASVRNVRMFAFSDTHDGVYVLAPPNTKYKTLTALTKKGVPFAQAMKQVMAQLKGKRLAIDDTGAHRTFIDGIFSMGGISIKDLGQLVTVDDGKMTTLARGGQVDFVKPLGGATEAELMQDGWYPLIGVRQVIQALKPGDPRGISAIGNTGLMTTQQYFAKNKDTLVRFASVMYRTIDAMQRDLKSKNSNPTLSKILAPLKSAAGVNLNIKGLRLLYGSIYSLYNFEKAAGYWTNQKYVQYFKTVYQPQITAAKKGGILPNDASLTTTNAFGWGQQIYQALVKYKKQYDQLAPKAKKLTGNRAALAKAAAQQYKNRNYLDAARFLSAAVNGK